MIKDAGLDFANLPESEFDDPFGQASGGGAIFGATGGVMEAALRLAARTLGDEDEPIVFDEVRGTKGIKEATYTLGGVTVNVAVASGLGNARKVMDDIKSGKKNYTFVEIMACPGGCINGGGQPYIHDEVRNNMDLKTLRATALYDSDRYNKYRISSEPPAIKKLYEEFLGEPNSHRAHELLHTTYVERPKY